MKLLLLVHFPVKLWCFHFDGKTFTVNLNEIDDQKTKNSHTFIPEIQFNHSAVSFIRTHFFMTGSFYKYVDISRNNTYTFTMPVHVVAHAYTMSGAARHDTYKLRHKNISIIFCQTHTVQSGLSSAIFWPFTQHSFFFLQTTSNRMFFFDVSLWDQFIWYFICT